MTSSLERQVNAIVRELTTPAEMCGTCYGFPVRRVYADGESMPASGCPECGRPVRRVHRLRWLTAADAARLFERAES